MYNSKTKLIYTKEGKHKFMATKQINISLPNVVLSSIDDFLQYGDGWDIEPHKYNIKHNADVVVDITKTACIKFLYSAYGDKETDVAEYIYDSITENDEQCTFISIRTSNPELIANHTEAAYAIVKAMVWMGIPITDYFDGRQVIENLD